jgi:1-acyl-sn-glycerol-3-phosphate acyltransferase
MLMGGVGELLQGPIPEQSGQASGFDVGSVIWSTTIGDPGPTVKNSRRVLHVLYQPYKWLIFGPLLVISTCFFVGLGIIMLPFTGDRVVNRTVLVWWARFNSFMVPMWVTVIGRDNIKKNQSYVVVSNHQSLIDSLVLVGWLRIELKWVMKNELRKFPVFGYAAEKGGQILIDRSNPKAAYESLRNAKDKTEGGTSIVVVPEGTRSRTGKLGEFKKGAFWLAQNINLPILPITLINTRNILPPDTLDLFPGRAVMKIHQPVDIADYGEGSLDRLISDVRSIIQMGLDEYQG